MRANEIGSVIKSLLLSGGDLPIMVGRKVFPIIAPPGTDGDFIVYRRTGVKPAYTKDRNSSGDTATVEILVVSDEYARSVDIMNAVFVALQNKSGVIESIDIDGIQMVDSEEEFQDDMYIQNMTFEIEIY